MRALTPLMFQVAIFMAFAIARLLPGLIRAIHAVALQQQNVAVALDAGHARP